MAQELEVEVKMISMESIKPSDPIPLHPKTFTLSLPDQIYHIINIPVLLFYTGTAPTPVDVSGLKASLSQTLNQFYPLAGRLLDEYTISCNNQGIPFIETKVDCHLSSVLTSPHKMKLLTKFLPPQEFRVLPGHQQICEAAPLAFQINVFLCGGMVLGCYMLHKVLDAASFGTFLKHWSALASKRFEGLVQPDFEATIKAFPPIPNVKNMSSPDIGLESTLPEPNLMIMTKSFLFDTMAINELKARAKSKLTPKPTGFEAVMGFIWEHMLATTQNLGVQVEQTTLTITVNMRRRMSLSLPRESIGNLITNAKAQAQVAANKSNCPGLQELVKAIHSTLNSVNERISSNIYQGVSAAELFLLDRMDELQSAMACEKAGIFRVTSWCKLGLEEADFGFGKPIWIVPIDGTPFLQNFVVLTDCFLPINGDGIEAWISMEEKEMQTLESNPHFLAFASPN